MTALDLLNKLDKTIRGGTGDTGYIETCQFTDTAARLNTGDGRGIMALPVKVEMGDKPAQTMRKRTEYGVLLFWHRYTGGEGPVMTTLVVDSRENSTLYDRLQDGASAMEHMLLGQPFDYDHGGYGEMLTRIEPLSPEDARKRLSKTKFHAENYRSAREQRAYPAMKHSVENPIK
jgi:hypothetical protein